uniref:Uncharacterized protein n=1 Tax=Triticum urartu TaxID=4572 RepID=A0A8R7K045_TRIUA
MPTEKPSWSPLRVTSTMLSQKKRTLTVTPWRLVRRSTEMRPLMSGL